MENRISEDIQQRRCARCGQPVNRLTDSYKRVGDDVIHTSCPVSEAVKTLPAFKADQVTDGPGRPQFNQNPQFITTSAAAKMLSVSTDTLMRRIRAGQLPAKRLAGAKTGGRETILVNQADVLALLEDYNAAGRL